MQIERGGVRSSPVLLPVVPSSPGIFVISRDGGRNQGAILNEDFSINGPGNAAVRSSIIQIFATGGGLTGTADAPDSLVLPAVVRIGGRTAELLYAGQAPGLVPGAVQVNARIPTGLPPGDAEVVLSVGGRVSPPGVVVAVR
jgi:uncharacterized protein (TIGR03437 family)